MSQQEPRKRVVLGLILLIFLAGCAQVTIHSSVSADGTIDEYEMQINTSRTVYGLLEESTEEEGYDSLRESLLSDLDERRAENIEYDEEFRGDSVTITITANEVEPGVDSGISVREEDGMLVYEDTTFVNETAQEAPGEESEISQTIVASLSVDYYLTMPGRIVESNADQVEGNTAEWHESGSEAFNDNRIYAKSEIPTGAELPGFGMGTALAAIFMLTVIGLFGKGSFS